MGQHEFITITDERLARQSLADYRFRLIGEIRESSKGSITVANVIPGSKMFSRSFLRACERAIYSVEFCDTKLYRVKYNLFVSLEFPVCFT